MAANPQILIRRATTKDAADVATIYIASRRGAAAHMPTVHTDPEIREWVINHMVPERETWVADDHGRIAAVMVLDGEMVDQMYVAPAEQRRGVGDAMLSYAKKTSPHAPSPLYISEQHSRAQLLRGSRLRRDSFQRRRAQRGTRTRRALPMDS